MRLLQVTALFVLLSISLCRSEDNEDVQNNSPAPPEPSTAKASVTTVATVSTTNVAIRSTPETPPKGTTNTELSKTPLVPTLTSLTTEKHEETTTQGAIKNKVLTTKAAVSNLSTSNAVSMQPSSQHNTENQSSMKTTETSVTTQLPDALPKTTVSLTTAKTISQLQDTEDGKITGTPSNMPSYSSIILPVVIALIVITILVFTLVGLYRICWKRDPGTPENGNDQPQSDKESVKLLTVKTLSHESGEHSAQGKTKN